MLEKMELRSIPQVQLADLHPSRMQPLLDHLRENILSRTANLEADGHQVEVLDPAWCREHSEEAGQLHAQVIVGAYGSTYALPNKDPVANKAALEMGNLDMYLMKIDGEVTGTACLVDMGDGRAELGRSASRGRSSNSIIQDLRIFEWLTNPEVATKYHSLFTTLRSAPDRSIDDEASTFTMRGGQAVTQHWRKFPELRVNGIAPLYLKHGSLEQFSCASISRAEAEPSRTLYVANQDVRQFILAWHDTYAIPRPPISAETGERKDIFFEAHYPPRESGLTDLVHADISPSKTAKKSLLGCLEEATQAGSPFVQVIIPIESDTTDIQRMLEEKGYVTFGYTEATDTTSACLLYGKVCPGIKVVPTHWDHEGTPNPFWANHLLEAYASGIAQRW